MPSILQRIQQQSQEAGMIQRTDAARKWLLSLIPSLKVTSTTLMQDRQAMRSRIFVGRMYFFRYDALGKNELPYFDRFPLVIPIDQYPDGFLGLNLHYLPVKMRCILMNKLSVLLNTPGRYDERTRLRISYKVLQSHGRIYEHTPAVKRYLYGQIKSRFLEVPPPQWDIAALLPTASFRGATVSEVYADSRKKIQERNT
jgi:hypothetical protein